MPAKPRTARMFVTKVLLIVAFAALAFHCSHAQTYSANADAGAKAAAAGTSAAAVGPSNASDVAKTLKAAAEAVGLARWSGVGGQRLPEVDVINTMEIWGSGTTYGQEH